MLSEEQQAEIELLESAFGDLFSLVDNNLNNLTFTIKLSYLEAKIQYWLPLNFPNEPLRFTIDTIHSGPILIELKKMLINQLQEFPTLRSIDIYQLADDFLYEHTNKISETDQSIYQYNEIISELKIGRFLIFFHHIMSTNKRNEIIKNAKELKLYGISKYGFPGIVIIEGLLENILEYIRRIQRLRWQHMIVKGEEIETITIAMKRNENNHSIYQYNTLTNNDIIFSNIDEIINHIRKIKINFYEINGTMSDVSTFCKQYDLFSLFMKALKYKIDYS